MASVTKEGCLKIDLEVKLVSYIGILALFKAIEDAPLVTSILTKACFGLGCVLVCALYIFTRSAAVSFAKSDEKATHLKSINSKMASLIFSLALGVAAYVHIGMDSALVISVISVIFSMTEQKDFYNTIQRYLPFIINSCTGKAMFPTFTPNDAGGLKVSMPAQAISNIFVYITLFIHRKNAETVLLVIRTFFVIGNIFIFVIFMSTRWSISHSVPGEDATKTSDQLKEVNMIYLKLVGRGVFAAALHFKFGMKPTLFMSIVMSTFKMMENPHYLRALQKYMPALFANVV
jgi:hypothetical protein